MHEFVLEHHADLTPAFFNRFESWAFAKDRAPQFVAKIAGICANCWADLGNCHYTRREYAQAVWWYERALKLATRLQKNIACKNLLYALGQAQFGAGQWLEAEASWQAALQLAKELENHEHDATSLNDIGSLLATAGRWEQAVSYYLHAREALSKAAKQLTSLSLAIDINLGNVHRQFCDAERALFYYGEALETAIRINYKQHENRILSSQGIVYRDLGELTAAREVFERSFKIAQKARDEAGESDALGNLGNLCYQQAQFEEARDFYEQALLISQKLDDRHFVTRWTGNLGNVYAGLGQSKQAKKHYEQALTVAATIHDLDHLYLWNYNLGMLYRRAFLRPQQAYDCFVSATEYLDELRRAVRLDDFSRSFAESKVLVYQDLVNVCLEIKGCHKQAINFAEDGKGYTLMRMIAEANVKPGANVPKEMRQKYDRLLAEQRKHEEILWALHEPEARSPETNKFSTKTQPNQADPASTRMSEKQLKYEKYTSELLRIREDQAANLRAIAEHDTTFADIYNRSPVTVARIQQHLQDHHRNTGVVEFFVTREQTIAFVITQDECHIRPLPQLTENQLNQMYRTWFSYYRVLIESNKKWELRPWDENARRELDTALEHWFREIDTIGSYLFEKLWRHIHDIIENLSLAGLVIVPHAALHLMPIHLVRLPGSQVAATYLCDRYEIVYSPSFRMFEICHSNDRNDRQRERLLSVSNPGKDLPWADVATVAIATHFKNPVTMKHENATYKKVVQRMPQFDILNFATHGFHVRGKKSESEKLIKMSRASDIRQMPHKQDPSFNAYLMLAGARNLTVRDIFTSLRLNRCHTAVLGACETGLVKLDQGDEYIGLPAAFLYAGAASVVSSLWAVESMATSILTTKWFDYFIKDGMSRRKALAKAQTYVRHLTNEELAHLVKDAIEKIESGACGIEPDSWEMDDEITTLKGLLELLNQEPDANPYAHPFYWGGFMVTGNANC